MKQIARASLHIVIVCRGICLQEVEAMPFYLSLGVAVKLVERFRSFEADRALVKERMAQFRRRAQGLSGTSATPLSAREALRELFRKGAPALTHHITRDPMAPLDLPEPAFVWELADAAVVLDRSPSTLSRALADLSCRRLWRARLVSLRRDIPGRRAVMYADGLFELVIDFYELSYLERFLSPRAGVPAGAAARAEVLGFWRFMHEHAFMSDEELLDLNAPGARPSGDAPPDAGIWADRPQILRSLLRDLDHRN